jgi:hypothetical protein
MTSIDEIGVFAMKRMDAKQGKMFYTADLEDPDILLIFESKEEWLSRRQIAERLWRSVTPGLIGRIENLVATHKLIRKTHPLPNKQVMFWYKLAQ